MFDDNHKIVEATLFFKWFLTTFNYGAITTPWLTIYVRKDKMSDEGLIRHRISSHSSNQKKMDHLFGQLNTYTIILSMVTIVIHLK